MAVKRSTESNQDLGRVLRDARKAAKLSQVSAGQGIQSSQTTIARIESGSRGLAKHELAALLDLYQPRNRAEIERLAGRVDRAGLPLNQKFVDLLHVQERAVAIRTLTSERIPMPLQCEPYVLKQYGLADPSLSPTDVLRLHARRVDILRRAKGPTFEAVMSHSSLLRMPGGHGDLRREQAQYLLDLLDAAPRLTVRVLGFDAAIPYLDGDFTLVVTRGTRAELAYVPFGRDGYKITHKGKIKEREIYWRQVWAAARSVDDTRNLLQDLARGGFSEPGERITADDDVAVDQSRRS